MCEWLAMNGASVVCAGRSRERGEEVVAEMRKRSPVPEASFSFVPVDAMRFANVRKFSADFVASQPRLDYLVLSPGIASVQGRTLTPEGVDEKMMVHFYGRVAIIEGLMPLLERTAAQADADVRVMSVLSGGVHSAYKLYERDPELRDNYSLKNAADAAGFYNDAALDQLAHLHPKITFSHVAPGFVATSWGTELPWYLRGMTRVVQCFAKSPLDCANLISAALVDDKLRGGFRVVDSNGRPAQTTPEHTEAARNFLWKHTMDIVNKQL